MSSGRVSRLFMAVALGLTLLGAYSAFAAANAVPRSGIGQSDNPVMVQQLAPPECASIAAGLTGPPVVGSGNINGTNANELILGSATNDTIDGRNGDDCIVGGDGNDSLSGGPGNDVLVGGSGDDALDGGSGTDICYGGSGIDTAARCETTYDVP